MFHVKPKLLNLNVNDFFVERAVGQGASRPGRDPGPCRPRGLAQRPRLGGRGVWCWKPLRRAT